MTKDPEPQQLTLDGGTVSHSKAVKDRHKPAPLSGAVHNFEEQLRERERRQRERIDALIRARSSEAGF